MIFFANSTNTQRWLISCLFVCLCACDNTQHYNQLKLTSADSAAISLKNIRAFNSIAKAKSLVKQGDLIMRTGNDFTSEMLEQLCFTDKTYSHCGIANIENDTIFVYHSIGGEWNPDEKLRRDPFELFCNPFENRGFGVFSFDINEAERYQLDSIITTWYKKGIMFDMKFDLVTDDRLYCSEFVSKAVTIATTRKITFTTSSINRIEYVAPDNLFLNSHCIEKLRQRF